MKKKDRGIIKLLILVGGSLFVGLILGSVLGFFSRSIEEMVVQAPSLRRNLLATVPTLFYGSNIFFSLGGLYFYWKGKKKLLASIEEDKDIFEEDDLSISLGFWSIGSYLLILVYALYIQAYFETLKVDLLLPSLLMMAIVIFYAYMQKLIVDLIKSAYPEKEGAPLDLTFQRDWLSSLDEREKEEAYFAGFKAFSLMNALMLAILFLLIILGSFIRIQVITFVILLILVVATNVSYFYYSVKGRK